MTTRTHSGTQANSLFRPLEGPPPKSSAITNTFPPSISGTPGYPSGSVISVTTGTWAGVPAPVFSYQWQRAGVDIPGETGTTYTGANEDAGVEAGVRCRVRATNSRGYVDAFSPSVIVTDPSATAWISAQEAAGVVFTSPQKLAVTQFYGAQKVSGAWGLMRFLYPTWSTNGAANAIDMVELRTAAFPNGMGHSAGYIVSNGASRYMSTNYNFADNPVGSPLTVGYLCVLPGANNSIIMHANNNPTNQSMSLQHALYTGPIFSRTGYPSAHEAGLALASQTGILVVSQTGSGANTLLSARRTSSGYTLLRNLSSSAATLTDSRDIICMANYANSSTTINNFNTVGRYGSFFLGEGLNAAQIESFTLGLKNLYESLTGLSIP